MPIPGLNTGYSGLTAAQIGLDTASNNIANANTEGYTRQRVEQGQLRARDIQVGQVGQGTSINDITRARDAFLDERVRSASAQTAAFETNSQLLSRAESLLAEPDYGVTSALDDLWSGFEDLALDPSDQGRRTAVKNQLDVITTRLNSISTGMDDLVADASSRVETSLASINDTIAKIAQLNETIGRSAATGTTPNDLLDNRDLLIDSLVTDIGATVTYTANGHVRVSLNGLSLVDGVTSRQLDWNATTQELTHENGLTLRVGGTIGGLQKFIQDDAPQILGQLDDLTTDLVTALNTKHAAGFSDSGVAGANLLDFNPTDPAGTVFVALTSTAAFALSAVDGTPFPIHNGDNALSLSQLRNDLTAAGATSSLLDAARGLISEVGSRTSAALAQATAQANLKLSAELSRSSAHGVNLDEEMIELIRYQRAYEAAARIITAADQALDTLINRTGIVGR